MQKIDQARLYRRLDYPIPRPQNSTRRLRNRTE